MKRKTLFRVIALMLLMVTVVSMLVVPSAGAETKITYRAGYNNVSSAYKGSKFYKQLTALPLTGNDVTNVMAVALSQLGYLEGTRDGDFDGKPDSGYSGRNFTEMNWNMGGLGYYGGNYEWCAGFVSFSLLQGRATDQNSPSDWCRKHIGDKNYVWREVSCTRWITNLKALNNSSNYNGFQKSKVDGGTYTPKAGDQIYFYRSGHEPGHVGLVIYTDSKYVYTIEGNTNPNFGTVEGDGNGVYFKKYTLGNSSLAGYGVLPYKNTDNAAKIDYTGKNPTPGLYVSAHKDGKGFFADKDFTTRLAKVPTFAQVEVLEVVKTHTLKTNHSDDDEVISTLKVKYNGQIGYMKDTEGARLVQITKSSHTHSFTEQATKEAYLVSAANCESPAVYAMSCSCGEASSTLTFTSGSIDTTNHVSEEFTYTANNNGTHVKKYTCCDTVVSITEACSGGDATCQDKALCQYCEAVWGNTAAHDFTVAQNDETHHWKKCEHCDATSTKEPHGGAATCTAKAHCPVCDIDHGGLAEHSFTVVKYDATRHWNKCEHCNAIDNKTAHTFNNNKCDCGAEKTDIAPEVTIPTLDDFEFDTSDNLPESSEMVVKHIDANSSAGKAVLGLISEFGYNRDKGVVIMDIHALSEGVKVQPNGSIRISVNKPVSNIDDYVIYHIKDNGAIEIINATPSVDGKLNFSVSSFSNFVFAERDDTTTEEGLPSGIIAAIVIVSICVLEMLVFAFVWFVIKKKSFASLADFFK